MDVHNYKALFVALYLCINVVFLDKSAEFNNYFDLYIFLFFLVSIAINFYLYTQKKFIVNNNKIHLSPEEWGKTIQSQTIELGKNSVELKKMISIFNSMKTEIDLREEEIQRYKEGYDQKIYKDFLLRFIRISFRIEKIILKSNDENNKDLSNLSAMMEDSLDECGVCKIDRKRIINRDFRNLGNLVRDNPETIETYDIENNFLIKDIYEDGYQLQDSPSEVIISPAKVSMYLFNED